EDVGASARQTVVATPPLAGLLDPAAMDPAPLLEPVEQRIERRDAKLQDAVRARLDELAQVVPVPGLILDERENQQLRAPFFQLAVEHRGLDIRHSDILFRGI